MRALGDIHLHEGHPPGKPPKPNHVSAVFGAKLADLFGGHEAGTCCGVKGGCARRRVTSAPSRPMR